MPETDAYKAALAVLNEISEENRRHREVINRALVAQSSAIVQQRNETIKLRVAVDAINVKATDVQKEVRELSRVAELDKQERGERQAEQDATWEQFRLSLARNWHVTIVMAAILVLAIVFLAGMMQ